MGEKKPVYNGYEEYYMTGAELQEYFSDAYELFGRHHEMIASTKLDILKKFKKVKSDIRYRIFLNDSFCRVMNEETDEKICFFGYTKEKPAWAKD